MTLPFSVIVITDWALGRPRLLEQVASALEAGPGVAVQHRHVGVTDAQFYDEAQALAAVCARANAPLFINGRLEVALALGAHLHCTTRSLQPSEVRARLAGRWISTVVHDADDDVTGADLALVSPVFTPGSKVNDTRPPLGPGGFEAIARQLPCPAFALGGVSPASVLRLQHVRGVAAISSVLEAETPRDVVAALLKATRP
ncbi:MAG: thiamine phosphate synthase [Myxococcaceae bacterium]|nr:thiamine phosphate synthase [Myxococcaceae bacterium]